MRIDVSPMLKNPGQPYPVQGSVELAPMQVLDDRVVFEDVLVSGDLTGAGESVSLRGRITATVRSRCARCLEPVEERMSVEVDEVFAREPNPKNPDLYPMDGYAIELDESVKDALLLDLPIRFLCRADCAGLCPVCGKNRNLQRCTCQDEGGNRPNPFSALSELLTEDEEV